MDQGNPNSITGDEGPSWGLCPAWGGPGGPGKVLPKGRGDLQPQEHSLQRQCVRCCVHRSLWGQRTETSCLDAKDRERGDPGFESWAFKAAGFG